MKCSENPAKLQLGYQSVHPIRPVPYEQVVEPIYVGAAFSVISRRPRYQLAIGSTRSPRPDQDRSLWRYKNSYEFRSILINVSELESTGNYVLCLYSRSFID